MAFLLTGLGVLGDDPDFATAGVQAWAVGAIGTMALAVMMRISRGHTRQTLTAKLVIVVLCAFVLIAAVAGIAAGLQPQRTLVLLPVFGLHGSQHSAVLQLF